MTRPTYEWLRTAEDYWAEEYARANQLESAIYDETGIGIQFVVEDNGTWAVDQWSDADNRFTTYSGSHESLDDAFAHTVQRLEVVV